MLHFAPVLIDENHTPVDQAEEHQQEGVDDAGDDEGREAASRLVCEVDLLHPRGRSHASRPGYLDVNSYVEYHLLGRGLGVYRMQGGPGAGWE